MPTPEIVHQLVKRFEENIDSYRSSRYNETQLRREFLDPFFEALGKAIDRLVYELSPAGMIYGLADEEIGIVEGAR